MFVLHYPNKHHPLVVCQRFAQCSHRMDKTMMIVHQHPPYQLGLLALPLCLLLQLRPLAQPRQQFLLALPSLVRLSARPRLARLVNLLALQCPARLVRLESLGFPVRPLARLHLEYLAALLGLLAQFL